MQFLFKDITSISQKNTQFPHFSGILVFALKKREIADVRGLIIHFKIFYKSKLSNPVVIDVFQ